MDTFEELPNKIRLWILLKSCANLLDKEMSSPKFLSSVFVFFFFFIMLIT